MHPFATYVLRSYYKQTGWNEDNLYSNLTRSSTAILDFLPPKGLNFTISKSPTPLFKTSYSMSALPRLNGSVGYIFTSANLDIADSSRVPFKELVERFTVHNRPLRPADREEVWLAGEKVEGARDYLLYGRVYVPTGRLDALYSTRLTPTLQAVVAAISAPVSFRTLSSPSLSGTVSRRSLNDMSNLMFSLQHDTGKWCSEYTWSADDGMLGWRVLHNFGKHGQVQLHHSSTGEDISSEQRKRVDEEDAMEGGLKGRISAGAEVYFSAKEKSAGVSTALRFSTLPDATPPSYSLNPHGPPSLSPGGPPTTITATFNPLLGHISSAYAARITRNLAMATRFDFNFYSYESEWALGLEWWIRNKNKRLKEDETTLVGGDLRPTALLPNAVRDEKDDIQGVVKARASTSTKVALMWEGRIRNLLISLGVVSDLAESSKPIRQIGIELAYFSSSD